MSDLGNKLKSIRISKNLTILQVSEATNIRPHVIEELEKGNSDFLPDVYIKSFIRNLYSYYKIDPSTINFEEATPPPQQQIIPDKELSQSKVVSKSVPGDIITKSKSTLKDPEIERFAQQFKKRQVKKVSRNSLSNYIIFSVLGIAVILAIVITIISLQQDHPVTNNPKNAGSDDTLKIEVKDKDLLSYFENTDSLNLRAVAKDTAWLRVIIDNSNYSEQMMKPGEIKEWNASEQFTIDVGNIGAIIFFRNNQQLPFFGKKGTVAKNIKITKDNVINISSIQGPKDTTDKALKAKPKKKKEKENATPPPIIKESSLPQDNNLLKKR